jgi:hypothetical protein
MTRVVIGVALAMLGACHSGPCGTVVTDRDATTGTIIYRPGSTKTPFEMSRNDIWSVGRSSLEVDVVLTSPTESARTARLVLEGLARGPSKPLTEGTAGRLCLVLSTGAAPTCLSLEGNVEVRRLEIECFNHESGISLCAENVDVTVHATSQEKGVSLQVDVDVGRAQHWTDPECRD